MRRRHLEELSPFCPVCRGQGRSAQPLGLTAVAREEQGQVVEGRLQCPEPGCQREYPILDNMPLLLSGLREYVAGHVLEIYGRRDLSAPLESLLGDCCGPGSSFDSIRQHLSTYARDHWGDVDPAEGAATPAPGSIVRLLERGLELARVDRDLPPGPVLDLGCAVGRSTFELAARLERPVLGVDLHYSLLRLAAEVLRTGWARYPRRRLGVVYERRELAVSPAAGGRVDFWLADATDLPLPDGRFPLVVSLNLLDCVTSPRDHLAEVARLLAPGGRALISTPYDWSPAATPMEAWLGGHSQRGEGGGAGEPVLRALITPGAHPASVPGLQVVAEDDDVPWRVWSHDRSSTEYRVHVVVVERQR